MKCSSFHTVSFGTEKWLCVGKLPSGSSDCFLLTPAMILISTSSCDLRCSLTDFFLLANEPLIGKEIPSNLSRCHFWRSKQTKLKWLCVDLIDKGSSIVPLPVLKHCSLFYKYLFQDWRYMILSKNYYPMFLQICCGICFWLFLTVAWLKEMILLIATWQNRNCYKLREEKMPSPSFIPSGRKPPSCVLNLIELWC